MSGVENPTFEEIELGLNQHKLRLSLDLKGSNDSEANKMSSINIKEEDNDNNNPKRKSRFAIDVYLSKHQRVFKISTLVLLNLFVFTYFIFATLHWVKNTSNCDLQWCNGYGMLLILVLIIYSSLIYYWIVKRYFQGIIKRSCLPVTRIFKVFENHRYGYCWSRIIIYGGIGIGIIIFLIIDTMKSRERLISISGVLFLMLSGWLCSKHPNHINWRPVITGMILQFVFGLISIRWAVGRSIFQCVSKKIAAFLDFAKIGATFVFSQELVEKNVFAFGILPVIYFFSFMIQMMYYLGAMQWIILKAGCVLQSIMGTTLCESVTCIANIFLGMSESPLLIKPYISKLTASELHAVMSSGFASVSGTVLAAYISFGAQPAHLLTASIMSAPASLCYSKLFYPETEKSLTSSKTITMEKSDDTGILDAATKGALAGIPLVLGIIANIIAFVSLIAFINAMLFWLGGLIGYEHLTLEMILSKLFMPLSFIMGVPWDECERVGTLIGLKTVVNEFIAYQKLGEFKNSMSEKLSERAEAIATYAICGFSNPGSIGIMIGSLSTLAPEKRKQITAVTIRAFIAGSATCFLTASIAGILIDETFFDEQFSNKTVGFV